MLAWKKYELYEFNMRLAYVQLWNLDVDLVSNNTYEPMQRFKLSLITSSHNNINTIMYFL